ncbi:AraC family transcriptional regulator [Paenibacillus sp. HJGM_3]|uniref:AraC family transcriptional regulator n=1 Tax=Paenibacillus sp. HJGM_3 TaxID=3379816 RepID=UPI00385DE5E1
MYELAQSLERLTFRISGSCGKTRCRPGWYWDHQTPFADFDIFYVVSGKGTMRLGGETFELSRKSCIIMRPGDLPKATQDQTERLVVLFIHFSLLGADAEPLMDFEFPRHTQIGESFEAETVLFRMIDLRDIPVPLQALEFDALMKCFFAGLFRHHLAPAQAPAVTGKQLQAVRRLMAVIRQEGGVDIDLQQLADRLELSPQYMSRLFKAATGKTLKSYIAVTKMETAKDLFIHTRMNVTEVAEQLGYSDVYAFSKCFKMAFGLSPTHFLTQIRASVEA